MNIIFLNNNFIPQTQATIPIMDRGFLFGDGVYEVIPIFDGKLFGCDEHLARLEISLNATQIKNPYTVAEWKNIFEKLLEKNPVETPHSLYCQITRGVGKTRNHFISDDLVPTVVCFLMPCKIPADIEMEKGFSAITLEDSRRRDNFIKAIDLLPSILMMDRVREARAYEAILIRNNEVTECISSNVFIVKNNQLFTPPASHYILSGITRNFIIDIAKQNKIPCEEKIITPAMLKSADEIWVTGSTKQLAPIVILDNQPVGDGKAGPLWKRMKALYETYKKNHG